MSQQATEQFRQCSPELPARDLWTHPFLLILTVFWKKKSSLCYLVSGLRTRIKNCTPPPPPSRVRAPMWKHFPSALLLSTIGLRLISSSVGNSCLFFSLVCMLSGWHSLRWHMTNQIGHHCTHQRSMFSISEDCFLHPYYNHGHTKKKFFLKFFLGGWLVRENEWTQLALPKESNQ